MNVIVLPVYVYASVVPLICNVPLRNIKKLSDAGSTCVLPPDCVVNVVSVPSKVTLPTLIWKSGVLDFAFVNVGNYLQDKGAYNILLVLSELPGAKASYDGAPSIVDLNVDLGLSGLAPMGWTWWLVHKDTPDDVTKVLRDAMTKAMKRDDVQASIGKVGFVPLEWNHTQYEAVVGPVVKQLQAMGNALAWEEAELKKLQ